MKYKFKEQKDGIIYIENANNIVAKYKVNNNWREVNYSFSEDKINIRLFDRYKKYKDVTIQLGIEEIQNIP